MFGEKFIYLLLLLIPITTLSCHRGTKGQTNSDYSGVAVQSQRESTSMGNSIGVIILNDKRQGNSKEIVRLFNKDGSLWYSFSFYDDSDIKFDGSNTDFNPFAFHQDNFLLVFKCVGVVGEWYQVIVNENSGLRKFVKKDDPLFTFQKWEDHIINLFAVGVDGSTNPVLSRPENGERVQVPKGVNFYPDRIDGVWLRIRWDESESEEANNTNRKQGMRYGWIRWKDGNNIIIELFYFA